MGSSLWSIPRCALRTRVIGQHDRWRLTGQLGQHRRIRTGGGLIGCDDHRARVGHAALAKLGEPFVGGLQDGGHPFACRVQRGTPRAGGLLRRERLAQACGVFLAGAVPPARLAGVGQEDDGPDDAVGQRLGIAVGVVGLRAHQTFAVGLVGDERDRAVVAAERRAGQRQPAARVGVGLADGLAPALRVAAVMDLVENDQGAVVLGAHPVSSGVAGHLRVGDDDAVVLRRRLRRRVGELRIEGDADPRGGQRPLRLEVFGRHDDGDPLHGAVGQQLPGNAQGKRCLACTRSGDCKEIPRVGAQIPHQCPTLPAPQSLGVGPA